MRLFAGAEVLNSLELSRLTIAQFALGGRLAWPLERACRDRGIAGIASSASQPLRLQVFRRRRSIDVSGPGDTQLVTDDSREGVGGFP